MQDVFTVKSPSLSLKSHICALKLTDLWIKSLLCDLNYKPIYQSILSWSIIDPIFNQYKHSDTFADHKNMKNPKSKKKCDPTVVTLLNMRPNYSQSSRENPTSSRGTSPLAFYKELPSPREGPYVSYLELKIEKKVELKNFYLNFD